MGKKNQKCVNEARLLKIIDKGLDALESAQKHEIKAAKQRDKAIAALLDIEAALDGANKCKCKPKKSKSKGKGGTKNKSSAKQPETVESQPESSIATLMESLSSVRAKSIDDLEMIAGVGPKLAQTLNEMGVSTFLQIAEWTAEDINRVDQRLNFPGRVIRENWVEQAKALANGGRDEYVRVFGKEPR